MGTRRLFVKQAGIAAASLVMPKFPLNAFADTQDNQFEALREAIAASATALHIPGLVAAVVKNGRIVFDQTYGYADLERQVPMQRDHIFPVASITKTFAAVTLMQCAQEGKLSLDDYVLEHPYLSVGYFPEQLPNPNVRLKHVISHTSEGDTPGSNYIYNGARYNMIYGVFEKASGNTRHYEAVGEEVVKRIVQPLGLKDTLAGYPSDKSHPLLPRIVTTYNWDKTSKLHKADDGLQGQTVLYASAGLLTTVDDLASYSRALDEHTLLSPESYRQMTTPFVSTDGRKNPYGLGWASCEIAGRNVHWGYGYGDSYAALLVRVPKEKLTFILLTNSGIASGSFYLGYGNLLNSVFAHAFFKHLVLPKGEHIIGDELFSQALLSYSAESNFSERPNQARMLLRQLVKTDPSRFRHADLSLIYLLAKVNDPKLKRPMERAIAAYETSKSFHPDIHREIASWYDRNNDSGLARRWQHKLADSKGYGEQPAVQNACIMLGNYYIGQGNVEKGRSYLWRAALSSHCNNGNMTVVNRQVLALSSAK